MYAPTIILFYFVTPDMLAQYEKDEIASKNAEIYKWIDERRYEIEKIENCINSCAKSIQDPKTEGWERAEFEEVRKEYGKALKKENKAIDDLKLLLK